MQSWMQNRRDQQPNIATTPSCRGHLQVDPRLGFLATPTLDFDVRLCISSQWIYGNVAPQCRENLSIAILTRALHFKMCWLLSLP
mmetsp:Transcript_3423/g.8099  ORF Transcript_3423/g.8099 Transcript_3423/m.8099 type:complete len:85 (-) Transcript_3423:606-860(-)